MTRRFLNLIPLATLVTIGALPAKPAEQPTPAAQFTEQVAPFLRAHCIQCHGPTKQSGDVRLDDLTGDVSKNADRWLAVRDQLRDGLMPPAKEPRPDAGQARRVVAWVSQGAGIRAARLPNQGNQVPHELLFGTPAATSELSPARIWRLSPEGYLGFVQNFGKGQPKLTQPFTLIPARGVKDFAGLYSIDEPSTEILLRNAEAIVAAQTGKTGAAREFAPLLDPDRTPTRAQLETAIQAEFRLALGRPADRDDVERLVALYEKCAQLGDRPAAARTMLQAVLLRADAMFRSEQGKPDAGRRRMLAPHELVLALSLALGDRRDQALLAAAQKGELATREQVAGQVRRLLDDPKAANTRILRFFHEYFEYGLATEVFKDKPRTFVHSPQTLVKDTDLLVLHVLRNDRDVLRELLTTPLSYANYSVARGRTTGKEEVKPAVTVNVNPKSKEPPPRTPEAVYGFDKWPAEQPATLPEGQRLGILMQPSWLVAHSTNFETDPVRRGRWVRERLLGGTVPELPIGVAAQVPQDEHQTFRERLRVTRDAKCWKCHQKMDELGLPFEQFDHFGFFRTAEKGKLVVTTGEVLDSGDPKLDGAVADPRAFVHKLADSERVRQVFIRHAFRFFLGRNESLADAKTLQDADRAYVQSGGSFKALVTSLLTSDAFLYRR